MVRYGHYRYGGNTLERWAYLLIFIGATLWGSISIYVIGLYQHGFTPFEVVTIRVVVAAIILVIYLAVLHRSSLKIKWSDSKYFVGTGILSIVFFNWCMFTAIAETTVAISAILLYTAPAFVTLLSRLFFKEWLTKRKLISLLFTIIGCVLVIGIFPTFSGSVSIYGILVGLGSGLGYALYSIFGKMALKTYTSLTITTYTFIVASLFMFPLSKLWEKASVFTQLDVLLFSLGLGVLPTVLAYMLYTVGLSYVESSRASITTTIEPVVATLIGVLVFKESLSLWQLSGIMFILLALVIVQERKNKSFSRPVKDYIDA